MDKRSNGTVSAFAEESESWPSGISDRFELMLLGVETKRLKEAGESRLWLRIIAAENRAPIDEVRPLLDEANELVAIFTTSVKRLRLAAAAGVIGCALVFVYSLSRFQL